MHGPAEDPDALLLGRFRARLRSLQAGEPLEDDLRLEVALKSIHRRVPSPRYIEDVQGGQIIPAMRRQILDFMFRIGDYFKIDKMVIGKAILYFDLYLTKVRVPREELTRIALVCISIACKETECASLPPFSSLCLTLKTPSVPRDLTAIETKVLDGLRWNVNVFCAHEIAFEILTKVTPECLENKNHIEPEKFHYMLLTTSYKYLETLMFDYSSLSWPPVVLGFCSVWYAVFTLKGDIGRWGTFIKSFKKYGLEMKGVDLASKHLIKLLREAPNSKQQFVPSGNSIQGNVNKENTWNSNGRNINKVNGILRKQEIPYIIQQGPKYFAPYNTVRLIPGNYRQQTRPYGDWRDELLGTELAKVREREWIEGFKKVPSYDNNHRYKGIGSDAPGVGPTQHKRVLRNFSEKETAEVLQGIRGKDKGDNNTTGEQQEGAGMQDEDRLENGRASGSQTPYSEDIDGTLKIRAPKMRWDPR